MDWDHLAGLAVLNQATFVKELVLYHLDSIHTCH